LPLVTELAGSASWAMAYKVVLYLETITSVRRSAGMVKCEHAPLSADNHIVIVNDHVVILVAQLRCDLI